MLDLQYEIPSKHSHVAKLTVAKDAVEETGDRQSGNGRSERDGEADIIDIPVIPIRIPVIFPEASFARGAAWAGQESSAP